MSAHREEVAKRAHVRWLRKGRPHNTQVQDWLEAEAELRLIEGQALKLAGKSLLESGQLLQAMLANSTALISVKDVQGRYLLVNHRFGDLVGMSPAQVTGKTDYDLFPAAIADGLRANDLRVLAARTAQEFEEVFSQGGAVRTYLAQRFPTSGPGGVPYAVCAISTDITTRKQAQRRLVAEHAVTQALAESIALGDAAPRILRAVCESLGWEVGVLWGVDPSAGVLRCLDLWHVPAGEWRAFDQLQRQTNFSRGSGLPGRVWESGQPAWVANVAVAADFARAPACLGEGLHGACAFPLQAEREFLGVMEFFSRAIREPDEGVLDMMASIGSQVGQFVGRKQVEAALHAREREFSLARVIQQRRLPKAAPVLAGFDIAGASFPAQETGGDYLDFIPLADGSLGIAVGDASGHGIAAALLMAETRAYLRALARTQTDVATILTLLNRHVTEDIVENDFVTMFLARLDPRTRTLAYGNAGNWPGYVLDARGEVKRVLCATGLPLGIDSAAEIPAEPALTLEAGDLVLLLTDGIVEAFPEDGPPLGVEGVLNTVRACRQESAGTIVAALLEEGRRFSGERQKDDMTAVVIRVKAGPGESAAVNHWPQVEP